MRNVLLALIVFWVAADCWAFPWDPVWWPRVYWVVQFGTFTMLAAAYFARGCRGYAIDVSLITVGSRIIASLAWQQWMMNGWFGYSWLEWLPRVTGSDGEGSYKMVEYEFFVLAFVFIAAVRLLAARRFDVRGDAA